jgi:hypothetical protein
VVSFGILATIFALTTGECEIYEGMTRLIGSSLWSSSQSFWLLTQRSQVRSPVWNGVLLALVRVNEELLERKVEAPV